MAAITARFRSLAKRAKKENVFFFYSSSTLVLQMVTMFATFAVLRYVPPEDMGIWRMLVIIHAYINFLTLGVPNGLSRELPFLFGRGDREKALRLAGVAQFYMLVLAGAGAVGFILPIFTTPNLPQAWSLALIAMAVLWGFGVYKSYLGVTYRSEHEFRRLTYVNALDIVLGLVSLGFVMIWGFEGMLFRIAFLTAVSTVVMHFVRPLKVRPHIKFGDLRELLETGIPQYFGGYLITASLAFEQTIIVQHGGTDQVGLYAAVAAVATAMTAIHAAIVTYINPRIIYRLGKTNDPSRVFTDVRTTVYLLGAISLPIILIGSIATPFVFTSLFPKYEAALPAIEIALIGGMFLAINATLTGLYTLKAWRWVAFYAISAVIIRWVVPSILVTQISGDLTSVVALGGAIANFLIFVIGMVMLWVAVRAAKRKRADAAVEIPAVLSPMD